MQRLTEALGEEEARTLMESLPPTFWYNLVTKDDLKAAEERIQAQFKGVDGKFEGIDAKFEGIEAEFTKVYGEFALIRGEMEKNKGEIALMIANQTRTLMLALTGFALSIWISLLVVGIT